MSPLAHPKGKTPSRSSNLRKGVFLRLPACQSLSLWEQRRRPPPVAETGRSCWGCGQQDASGSEADAGSRNPGSVTEGDGEGKPGRKEPWAQRWAGSLSERYYRCVRAVWQRPSPLSLVASSSPAPPKGEPLACRSAFVWTSEAQYLGSSSAPLSSPAAA